MVIKRLQIYFTFIDIVILLLMGLCCLALLLLKFNLNVLYQRSLKIVKTNLHLIILLHLNYHDYFSVYKPRKGMATPKQRLGRIIKIHKLMK
jgi:hypothetical protein